MPGPSRDLTSSEQAGGAAIILSLASWLGRDTTIKDIAINSRASAVSWQIDARDGYMYEIVSRHVTFTRPCGHWWFMCGLIFVLRLGRLDRKIELPNPDQEARARIMQIHSRKMNVSPDVNFDELSRCTDDYNGAMLKAVCVEAVRAVTEIDHLLLQFKNKFLICEETVVLRR